MGAQCSSVGAASHFQMSNDFSFRQTNLFYSSTETKVIFFLWSGTVNVKVMLKYIWITIRSAIITTQAATWGWVRGCGSSSTPGSRHTWRPAAWWRPPPARSPRSRPAAARPGPRRGSSPAGRQGARGRGGCSCWCSAPASVCRGWSVGSARVFGTQSSGLFQVSSALIFYWSLEPLCLRCGSKLKLYKGLISKDYFVALIRSNNSAKLKVSPGLVSEEPCFSSLDAGDTPINPGNKSGRFHLFAIVWNDRNDWRLKRRDADEMRELWGELKIGFFNFRINTNVINNTQ